MSATAGSISAFPQTVQAAVPYLLPVAAAGILAAIGITIGLVLIIVPGLILLTFWCLIVPFIVIGDAGPIDAFGKSMRTVRGYAWNVFGTWSWCSCSTSRSASCSP